MWLVPDACHYILPRYAPHFPVTLMTDVDRPAFWLCRSTIILTRRWLVTGRTRRTPRTDSSPLTRQRSYYAPFTHLWQAWVTDAPHFLRLFWIVHLTRSSTSGLLFASAVNALPACNHLPHPVGTLGHEHYGRCWVGSAVLVLVSRWRGCVVRAAVRPHAPFFVRVWWRAWFYSRSMLWFCCSAY